MSVSLGQRIIDAIEARRNRLRLTAPGPYGDYYRSGGNEQLYAIHLQTGDLVIDAGGYIGEWTEQMILRFGCRSEIFEPFPLYASELARKFSKNSLVKIHELALGGTARTAKFTFANDGTSEFGHESGGVTTSVAVVDVADVFRRLSDKRIGCLKLNIEGGEYEVLDRLIYTGDIKRIETLLVQFHRNPEDWIGRLTVIREMLKRTHVCEWCYPMLWEKWVCKADIF